MVRFLLAAATAATTVAVVSGSVQRLFDFLDVDKDGVFSTDEMMQRLSDKEHGQMLAASDDTYPDVMLAALVETLDADQDGLVTLADFADSPAQSNETLQQVHVSLTGQESEMLVMFVTLGSDPVPNSQVQVQIDGSWQDFNTTFETYSVPSRWWEPEGWQGWIYTAKVGGLEQGKVRGAACCTGTRHRWDYLCVLVFAVSLNFSRCVDLRHIL